MRLTIKNSFGTLALIILAPFILYLGCYISFPITETTVKNTAFRLAGFETQERVKTAGFKLTWKSGSRCGGKAGFSILLPAYRSRNSLVIGPTHEHPDRKYKYFEYSYGLSGIMDEKVRKYTQYYVTINTEGNLVQKKTGKLWSPDAP